ncbi:hypothetical protein Bhyg_12204 [Pseudolycoriella hygida]|uniref:Uncharacterized protein n=1 Tax=Pseudolycoriella hygida TaxID=35572 RepID=A0A9Q0MYF2_9DIPT|nr:hypothetical protein Bhyg_12204 [Pseudolycoriella hygida]
MEKQKAEAAAKGNAESDKPANKLLKTDERAETEVRAEVVDARASAIGKRAPRSQRSLHGKLSATAKSSMAKSASSTTSSSTSKKLALQMRALELKESRERKLMEARLRAMEEHVSSGSGQSEATSGSNASNLKSLHSKSNHSQRSAHSDLVDKQLVSEIVGVDISIPVARKEPDMWDPHSNRFFSRSHKIRSNSNLNPEAETFGVDSNRKPLVPPESTQQTVIQTRNKAKRVSWNVNDQRIGQQSTGIEGPTSQVHPKDVNGSQAFGGYQPSLFSFPLQSQSNVISGTQNYENKNNQPSYYENQQHLPNGFSYQSVPTGFPQPGQSFPINGVPNFGSNLPIYSVTNRTAADLSVDVLDLSVPKAHSTAMGSYLAPAIVAENISSTIEDSSKTNTSDDASTLNDLPVNASIPQFAVVAASSSLAIREIILPSKRPSIGRPKGTSKNVIGTERKAEAKSSTTKMAKAKAKPSKDMVPTLRSKRVRKLKADALDMIDNKLLRLRKLRK